MVELPESKKLPVQFLSACFNTVTASYKFYWFLSIIEICNFFNKRYIDFSDLFIRMIANIWHPTIQFKLFFGAGDKLSLIAAELNSELKLQQNLDTNSISNKIAALASSSE